MVAMGLQRRESTVSVQPDNLSPAVENGLNESKNRLQSSDPLDPDALLTRARLAEELNKLGYPITVTTLATKATRGGGPPYDLFGRRPLYRWRNALSWAEGRLTAPRCSSSEGDASLLVRADGSSWGDDPSSQPSRQKRKRGQKLLLSKDQVRRGKAFYRDLLKKDSSWADQLEASANKVLEELKFGVSWFTVKRRIIEPVLNKKQRAK
jgi:hypothetical protein